MLVLIDNIAVFFTSLFTGALIGGVFYSVFHYLAKENSYVERKYFALVFCIALIFSLLPQVKELLLEVYPADLIVSQLRWDMSAGASTNTMTAAVVGKILGCATGFFGGEYLWQKLER